MENNGYTATENVATEMKEAQESGVVNMESDKNTHTGSMNYTHTFSEPVTIEGKQYKTLTFYFEELTGRDIEAIEKELQDRNQYVISPEISSVFQSMLAARAARIGADEISRLKMGDYMKIKNKARAFLVDAGL